jgi:hypothetical protein
VTAHHDPSEQELRDLLAAIDPQRVGSPKRSALSEEAMAARIEEAVMSTTPTEVEEPAPLDEPASGWRRPWLAAAAAAVVLAGVGVAALVVGGDDGPGNVTAGPGETLELALPDPALSMSCVMFDVNVLADMSPAFAATATAVTEEQVVLDVEKWYAGTPAQRDAEQVTLARPNPASSAALDGVAFEQGETYLVTAADGIVNGCGFSGPATPKLRAAYEEAFAG